MWLKFRKQQAASLYGEILRVKFRLVLITEISIRNIRITLLIHNNYSSFCLL